MSRMGVDITGIDMAHNIGGLSDPEVNEQAVAIIGKGFPIWLGAAAELSRAEDGRIKVTAGDNSVVVDKVFASLGRTPNVESLDLAAAGVELNERGIPIYNPNTMQVGDSPIYLAGDIDGDRLFFTRLAMKARLPVITLPPVVTPPLNAKHRSILSSATPTSFRWALLLQS